MENQTENQQAQTSKGKSDRSRGEISLQIIQRQYLQPLPHNRPIADHITEDPSVLMGYLD